MVAAANQFFYCQFYLWRRMISLTLFNRDRVDQVGKADTP